MAIRLITGGTVVNAKHAGIADVLIDGEKIVGVLSHDSEIIQTAVSYTHLTLPTKRIV